MQYFKAVHTSTAGEGASEESGGGGGPASEASLPPEASQVVAEGDGLRVFLIYLE